MTMRRRKSALRNLKSRLRRTLFLLPFMALATLNHGFSHEPTNSKKISGPQRREVRIPIRDFRLIDQNSRSFDFKTVRANIVVLLCAYTTSTDVYPLTPPAMRHL